MSAYSETYLSGAQRRLGAFFDFATRGLGHPLERAQAAFLAHPVAGRFGAGDVAVVAGRSGEELAFEVMGAPAPQLPCARSWPPGEPASREYWTGWALAFYQWASGYSFHAIERRVPIRDIRSLYAPYHEMDIRQFCDRMDELCARACPGTNLQVRRQAAGLSQSQLARASGVPVRTLQQYEQRQKSINRARADSVEALARILGCSSSDLFEHSAATSYDYMAVPF